MVRLLSRDPPVGLAAKLGPVTEECALMSPSGHRPVPEKRLSKATSGGLDRSDRDMPKRAFAACGVRRAARATEPFLRGLSLGLDAGRGDN